MAIFYSADRKSLLPRRILLGLMLLVAASAVLSVAGLRVASEKYRRGLEAWLTLQSNVSQVRSLQTRAAAMAPPDAGLSDRVRAAHQAAASSLGALAENPLTADGAAGVRKAYDSFAADVEEWLARYSTPTTAAQAGGSDRLASSYDTLRQVLADAISAFAATAQKESLQAATTSSLLLGITFSLLGLLFWRFDTTRRTAVALEAEKWALRKSEERFQSLLRNANDVVLIADAEATMRYSSPAAEKVMGYPPDFLINKSALDLVHPHDAQAARALLNEAHAQPGHNITGELRLKHYSGDWLPFEVILNNLQDDPHVAGVVITARDIRERKAAEEEMTRLAFRDPLTGLANRTYFMQRLRSALKEAHVTGATVGLMFFDLDNFKVVNDSLGHDAGDSLLISIAERLNFVLPSDATAARLGGDEFTVLLENVARDEDLVSVAERFRSVLHAPFSLSGHDVFSTASIGLAVSAAGMVQPDALLQRADLALYKSKFSGKNQWRFFDQSMEQQVHQRLELETDLRRALERGEFRVFYQPVADLRTGHVMELEALVRWEHPTRGLLAPLESLNAAEETGLILPLGMWVLEEACRQLVHWLQRLPNRHLVVSVNISSRQLQHPLLVEQIHDILRQTGLRPDNLKLEVREGAIMRDAETSIRTMHRLKAMGVLLTLDDFGSGYNSLAALKKCPVDTLKIDRSFVDTIDKEGPDAAIIQAIITMADTLHLEVTCEGIETEEQYHRLRSLGCHRGQGYFIAHPMPEDQVIDYIAQAPLEP